MADRSNEAPMIRQILFRELLGVMWAAAMSGLVVLIYSPVNASFARLFLFFLVIGQGWVLLGFFKKKAKPDHVLKRGSEPSQRDERD
jgi:hypothetical protein